MELKDCQGPLVPAGEKSRGSLVPIWMPYWRVYQRVRVFQESERSTSQYSKPSYFNSYYPISRQSNSCFIPLMTVQIACGPEQGATDQGDSRSGEQVSKVARGSRRAGPRFLRSVAWPARGYAFKGWPSPRSSPRGRGSHPHPARRADLSHRGRGEEGNGIPVPQLTTSH